MRETREFTYTNEDGEEGTIMVMFGPWSAANVTDVTDVPEAPIMVMFEDTPWMGVEQAEEFQRWFKVALAEAKRRHPQLTNPGGIAGGVLDGSYDSGMGV